MSTLILVTSDSGAGHLKRERRADRIQCITHRLVTGPVPVGGSADSFFARRRALYEAEGLFHEPWWFDVEDLGGERPLFRRIWSRLPELCLGHDRVELWIDPDPNAQLVLLQLLDWLGRIPQIAERLWLKQAESSLGDRRPGSLTFPPVPVRAEDVLLAGRVWAAFGSSTPERWAALADDPDLDRLPGLRRAIEQLLDELPDATGLGATARRILALVEREGHWIDAVQRGKAVSAETLSDRDRCFNALIHRIDQWDSRLPLWHFEIGETLCDLGAPPAPAISGVTERCFDLAMHQDPERHRRFTTSPFSLTALGHRLVARDDDWSDHARIHRWWGGTRLTNDNLWRWDPESRQLRAPN